MTRAGQYSAIEKLLLGDIGHQISEFLLTFPNRCCGYWTG